MVNEREDLIKLLIASKNLNERLKARDPLTYNLPNLLRVKEENESDKEFKDRQNKEVREFIESKLYIEKKGVPIHIKLVPKMVEFISDLFYRRVWYAILWKPRGAGGSLCSAIVIFLFLVYHKFDAMNLAGSEEQSKVVFKYVLDFFDCFPDLKKALYQTDPTTDTLRLIGKAGLKSVPASQKAVRGQHKPLLVVDELSQKDPKVDEVVLAALQGPVSEPEHCIILCSTFHESAGVYQDIWDNAEEKGFTRYRWDIFDCCHPDTKVLTQESYKLIKDITSEDKVFSIDGKWNKVNSICRKFTDKKWLKIIPYGFHEGIIITEDHAIYGDTGGERFRNKFGKHLKKYGGEIGTSHIKEELNIKWNLAKDYKKNDYLAIPRPLKIPMNRQIEKIFEGILSPKNIDTWRFIGYFLGDGHAEKNGRITFVFNTRDRDWIEDLKLIVHDFGVENIHEDQITENGTRIRFSHSPLCKILRNNFYKKSKLKERDKFIPLELILAANIKQLESLLTGLVRSDGSIRGIEKNTIRFANKSPYIISAIITTLLRLGVVPCHYWYECNEVWHLSWLKDRTPYIKEIGESKVNFSRTAFKTFYDEKFIYIPIVSIEEIRENAIAYDISVEGGESFLAANTMAHNTMMTCMEPYSCLHTGEAKPCPLTDNKPIYGPKGDILEYRLTGCQGKARETNGFYSFAQVLKAKNANKGTDTFLIEFQCARPDITDRVFVPEQVELAISNYESIKSKYSDEEISSFPMVIGIDWGFTADNAVLLAIKTPESILVEQVISKPKQVVAAIMNDIEIIIEKYKGKNDGLMWRGQIPIYADGNNPQNIEEFIRAGFDIKGVPFNRYKKISIGNILKFFAFKRIVINSNIEILIKQLRRYRRKEDGTPIKGFDHAIDAMICAFIEFPFLDTYGELEGLITDGNDNNNNVSVDIF